MERRVWSVLWKLVNKPSGEESDDVHFYNAARLYVASAKHVQDVIREIETLQKLGAMDDPARAEIVAEALKTLQDSIKEHRENQKKLSQMMAAREQAQK